MLAGLARPVRHLPAPSPRQTMEWMSKFIQQGQFDYRMRALAEKIVAGLWPHDYLSEYAAILHWVQSNIRYSRDPRSIEQVKLPAVTIDTGTGDCVTHDTEIIVRDARGFYRIVPAGELQHTYAGYEALSYNFDENRWEFKPITAWADKGEQEVYRVRLTTGYTARVTSGHELLFWHSRANEHQRRKLSAACQDKFDEDGSRRLKQGLTVLAAQRIPTLGIVPGVPREQLWLGGAYTAEGWHDEHHTCIARSSVDREEISQRLDILGAKYTVRDDRPKSGGYINLHQGDIPRWLRGFGRTALTKTFPWELLSAPLDDVQELFDGYGWGDTWVNRTPGEGAHPNHVLMHSTVSNELAKQLKFIHMLLGRPLSANLVENHGGLGKNPIWRMWESTGKRYNERLPGLTNVGVRGVWYDSVAPVCDLTVADNHNFVTSYGLLAHNCDDLSVVIGTLTGLIGARVRLVAGGFSAEDQAPLSHVWLEAYEPNSKAWVVLDPVPGRKVGQMISRVKKTLVKEVLQ